MKILILNHCSHNKGDNSVLYYLTQCLDLVSNNDDVTVSCSDGKAPFWSDKSVKGVYWPGDKIFKNPEVSFGENILRRVNFMLMRKVLYKLFLYLYSKKNDRAAKQFANVFFGAAMIDAFKNSDKIICTGGHHISNVLEKDCVNPQLVSMAIADLFGHNPIMWSQSIGPIDTCPAYVSSAIGRVFDSCSQIFVRDDLSVACVTATSSAATTKAPDSVFLSNKLVSFDSNQNTNQKPYVCCAVYTAGIKDEKYLSQYRDAWVKISKGILDKGYEIVFVPMQYKGFGGDERPFLKEIVKAVGKAGVSYVEKDESPKDTLLLFKNSSFIIGHKTHSVIYGLALEIPTIAIAYHEKTRYFMSLFDLNEYVYEDVIGKEEDIISHINEDTVKAQDSMHASSKKSGEFAEQLIKNLQISIND